MTTTGDLYQQAWKAWTDCYLSPDGKPFNAVCAVVDLVRAAQDDRQPWEVLREAANIMHPKSHPSGLRTPDERALRDEAKRLESEHRAAQEKAAAEAAREKLIEQAARIVSMTRDHGPDRKVLIRDLQIAEALHAAGYLTSPETTNGGAA